jgi:transcriptional regulator with XRE-family HTH domain
MLWYPVRGDDHDLKGRYVRLESEKVRWHRDRLGWTLDTLAEQAEVAEGTALRAEHGEDIRPSSGRRIARALGVDISELVPEMPGVATRPKVLRPRTLDELLERAGLEAPHWLTLPDDEFDSWWLGVDWREAIRRFWEINAEYQVVAAAISGSLDGESNVDPNLRKQLPEIYSKSVGRHLYAKAAAPGRDETEGEFYDRQHRRETRQFEKVDHGKPVEEVVARAS